MDLDATHILSLAPDPASAAAGRKLAAAGAWQSLGRDEGAFWGECRGSALYQVRVDAHDFAAKCSCPSRKFPCKHSLGLLLLAASSPAAVPECGRPAWVADWIAGRAASAEAKQAKQARPAETDLAQQGKRAEKRLALVRQGIDGLDLWLQDVIRNGIAGVELQNLSFWEKPAARLVDCQAQGLALRVRRLAAIPGSSPRWPGDLLAALGNLALLTEAFPRLDTLPPMLQADVKNLIGWTLKEDEVVAHGDTVRDRWTVFGQWIEDDEKIRTQRTWLTGEQTGRAALVLQFSVAGSAFGAPFVPGTTLDATLAFWPSNYPLRAAVSQRHEAPRMLNGRLTGLTTVEEFLASVSQALSRQPWLDNHPCLLRDVIPAPASDGPWLAIDATGQALPLSRGEHWPLLAISGGYPIDIAGEWRNGALLPLGMQAGGAYMSYAVAS
jgi:SWIM zinc finger